MAQGQLYGKRVAILVTDGFEQVEMTEPRKALQEAGAAAVLIAPASDEVRGWNRSDWGDSFAVELALERADPAAFDALLLPGGVMSPDRLRTRSEAVRFVRAFFETGKPVAAICHGPWLIIETGFALRRRMAAWPSLKTDLRNAGAEWVDADAVTDGQLVTSRNPHDIPAFNHAMIALFARGPKADAAA